MFEYFFTYEDSAKLVRTPVDAQCIAGADQGWGVRVINDSRLGFGFAHDRERARVFAERALRFSPKADFFFPDLPSEPLPSLPCPTPEPDALAQVEEQVLSLVESPIRLTYFSIEAFRQQKRLERSDGELVWSEGDVGFFVYLTTPEGASGWRWWEGLDYPSPAVVERLVNEVKDIVEGQKEPVKVEPGLPVAFSPYVVQKFLLFFLSHLNLTRVREGTSAFADKEGKTIAAPFTVVDDPLAEAPGFSPVDDEGIKGERRELIVEGKLMRFFGDMYESALTGKNALGFASRSSYAHAPSPGLSNVVFRPDKLERVQTFEELGPFIWVEDCEGLHTANKLTGEFTCTVPTAFLHKNGEKKALKPFSICGNVLDMFKNIIAVEKNAGWFGRVFIAPILFDGIGVIS